MKSSPCVATVVATFVSVAVFATPDKFRSGEGNWPIVQPVATA